MRVAVHAELADRSVVLSDSCVGRDGRVALDGFVRGGRGQFNDLPDSAIYVEIRVVAGIAMIESARLIFLVQHMSTLSNSSTPMTSSTIQHPSRAPNFV